MLTSLREAVVPNHLSCEVIVVDNNSPDDTQTVLKEIGNHHDSIVRFVVEEKHGPLPSPQPRHKGS